MNSKLKYYLFGIYVLEFVALAIDPYSRGTWWAENIPIAAIVAVLVLTHRKFEFSPASYVAMSVLIFMHTIGGHYTFERVPFDWVNSLFGFKRNQYDRFAHFSVGFYAYPICEFLERKRLARQGIATAIFAVACIFTVAAFYEIIEWIYAVAANPEAGSAFLGTQGDEWDAQKDMLADGAGGILAAAVYFFLNARTSHVTKD